MNEERRVKYYIFEVEMPEEYEVVLRNIAEREKITLDELTTASLKYMTEHTEEVKGWKTEFDKLPENIAYQRKPYLSCI